MDPFTRLASVAAPLPQSDIDTDILYPARFLLITEKTGLGRYAFHDWRLGAGGPGESMFVLDRPPWRSAAILVVGANFGCGSSREQAPWALADLGIRCIIAPSFGEIFYGNCFKNGLLPIVAQAADHGALLADAQAGMTLVIDLEAASILRPNGLSIPFDIDPRRRAALLNGWDDIDLIRAQHSDAIIAFETAQRDAQPWLWTADQQKEERRG